MMIRLLTILILLMSLMIINTLSFKINNIIVKKKYNNNNINIKKKYNNNNLKMINEENSYSTKQILKEETEAPFRSLRKFIYISLLAGAGLGLAITIIKLILPSSNDNISELVNNLGINGGGVILLLYLLNRENIAQQALLERIKKGGSLAGLRVRLSSIPSLSSQEDENSNSNLVVKLSDLRRDRGIEKRVVIVAAPKELLRSSLETSLIESKNLARNDLLIVPLCIEMEDNDYKLTASSLNALVGNDDKTINEMEHLGLPIGINSWNQVIKYELNTAIKQIGLKDALDKGITIVLKKNGKVGSRRFGVPLWSQLSSEVENRESLGLDISNI